MALSLLTRRPPATDDSPLTTHPLLLAPYYSPLTTHP
jgi:hypothetical protein